MRVCLLVVHVMLNRHWTEAGETRLEIGETMSLLKEMRKYSPSLE